MLLKNSAEGGTNGTTVTTANSGGASGNAWDAVFLSTGAGTVVYDTAQSAHGGVSIRHSTADVGDSIQLQWVASVGTPSRLWGRLYYRTASLTLSTDVFRVRSSLGNQVARIAHSANTGLVLLRNGANSIVYTSTNAVVVNTWYRFEWDFRPGASVTNTVTWYAGDSTTPIETLSATSSYSTDTNCQQVHIGNMASQTFLDNRWFDDIAVSDVGPLGPAVSVKTLGALGVG